MSNYKDIKIDWLSEISAIAGYGLQARRMLRPLIEGGADIKIIPDEDYLPDFMKIDDPFWKEQIELSKSKAENSLRICWCLPPRAKINPKAKNVFYAQWETTQYPNEWVPIINSKAHTFLVGCNALVQSARNANITRPIVPLYGTIDTDLWKPEGDILGINEISNEQIKFLFIGNFIPRKNLEELIYGFSVAFQGQKDVALIIKTWSGSNTAEGKSHIHAALKSLQDKLTGINKPKICLITDLLDESKLVKLVRGCDVYTSVSKGEGLDLPVMQAMAMEKLIVTTRFLAHRDYLNDSNSLDVNFSLDPCRDAAAPLYDSYQYWSRPDMYHYITQLRQAYSIIKKDKQHSFGKEARKTMLKYNKENNTPAIANVIRSITNHEEGKAKEINISELVKNLSKQ